VDLVDRVIGDPGIGIKSLAGDAELAGKGGISSPTATRTRSPHTRSGVSDGLANMLQ
jgi:hypothetical protein